jgi:cyclase
MAGGAKRVREVVDELSTMAEIFLVNTHTHGDHAGGNKRFPEARVYAGAYEKDFWQKQTRCPYPDNPILPYEETVIQIGDETVHIRNIGRAHTWNDVVVYLENRKLLVTGDLIFNGWHPALLPYDGTHTESWIRALDSLETYDALTVVPGHGPVTDMSAVAEEKKYFMTVHDAVNNEIRLDSLDTVYADYWAMPLGSGFQKTVSIIKREVGLIE